ncbi:MAG: DUF3047 domain-containing protein [Polaromonas sp.]|uniref:DUF3047 domain-containing protein n=1 Tax=Polaromonas sp. TaxID=1869339 RepID=UPI003263F866
MSFPPSSPRSAPVRFSVFAVVLLALSLVSGCATRVAPDEEADVDEPVSRGGTLGPAEGVTGTAWAEMSAPPKAGDLKPDDLKWEIFRVPGKQPASYSYVRYEGRDAVLAKADASGSILRHRHRIEPDELGLVRFSWNVPNAGAGANLTLPQLDDVPVRVVLAFEGDRSRLSMKNSLLSELSRLLTGEEMPFATLVYSWSRVNRPGEVVVNDRTDRIRKIVVDSGDHGYNEWRSYERDIRADYRKAFGEDPGALLSFAVFTEGEKNEGQLQAFYGPLKLVPASAVARK